MSLDKELVWGNYDLKISDKKLDQHRLEKVVAVLCVRHLKMIPCTYGGFQNEQDLCRYIRLMVEYYNRNGEIHVAVDDEKNCWGIDLES